MSDLDPQAAQSDRCESTPRQQCPKPYVPAAQRYQAAWAEVNARLQSRLVIQGSFMTGVVVALLLGLVPQGSSIGDPGAWRTAVVFLLPVLTFATALWVRHNDAIIGHLSAFMQHLEWLDDPHQIGDVPGWHDSRYKATDETLHYRRYSDMALIIVGVVATAPAAVLTVYQAWGPFILISPLVPIYPLAGFVFGVAGMVVVFGNAKLRTRIKSRWKYGDQVSQGEQWPGRPGNKPRTWHWSGD